MAVVCPTVTADNPHTYREQLERVTPFADRIHLDFADGEFAPVVLVNVVQAWWPDGIKADFHLMLKRPLEQLETVISLKPELAIVHAEAQGVKEFLAGLAELPIKKGLALLQDTPVETIAELLEAVDHVLIFSGDLGHFGGHENPGLLEKVADLKNRKPALEIGWDGGINDQNIAELIKGGVDVLNVGGFIQHAPDPQAAYATLVDAAKHTQR